MLRLLRLGKRPKARRLLFSPPQFSSLLRFRAPPTILLQQRSISSSGFLRAEMGAPGEVRLDVKKSCVWNEDGLLTEQEVKLLSAKVKEIEKASGVRVLVYAVRNLQDWPPTAIKELGDFTIRLRVNSFSSPEESDR